MKTTPCKTIAFALIALFLSSLTVAGADAGGPTVTLTDGTVMPLEEFREKARRDTNNYAGFDPYSGEDDTDWLIDNPNPGAPLNEPLMRYYAGRLKQKFTSHRGINMPFTAYDVKMRQMDNDPNYGYDTVKQMFEACGEETAAKYFEGMIYLGAL